MLYDLQKVERYAMKAEEMTRADPTGWAIYIHEVGDQLGLSRADSSQIAVFLRDMGWASTHTDPDRLVLTPKGYEEIRKLRRPRWQRWMDAHPITMNAFWMTVTAIIAGIIYTLITYHLLKL